MKPAKKTKVCLMSKVLSFQLEHTSACAMLRLFAPLMAMNEKRGTWQADFAFKMMNGEKGLHFDPNRVDVAIFQRHFKVTGAIEVFYRLQAHGIPIIYECDDDLLNIPKSHPHKHIYDDLEEHSLILLHMADVVTVTSERLKELYAPYCKRIEIVPNHIDPEIWKKEKRWSSDEIVRIGYAGSSTHHEDLAIIEPALIRLMQEYGNKIELYFWGCCTENLMKFDQVTLKSDSIMNYKAYAALFQKSDLDIGLAPLAKDIFNSGKSAIKWKEYAAGSIPGVFSKIPSYEREVQQGVNGFVAGSDPEEWYDYLKQLIEDKELRQEMGRKCREQVMRNYTLDAIVDRWVEIFDSLPNKKSQQEAFPVVSIIIPLYNRADLTQQCLRSIFQVGSEIPFEVIVVNNASEDNTAKMLQEFEDEIRLVTFKKNAGFSKANNRAADISRGHYLVMLNNDTQVQPGWLEALVNCQQETGAAMVGARLFYPDGKLQHGGIAIYPDDNKPHVIYCALDSKHPDFEKLTGVRRSFQIVTAACWLVTRQTWVTHGGFDERYINGYEDVDFCLRVSSNGGLIMYEPQAKVIHYESQSPGRAKHTPHNENLLFSAWRDKWTHDLDLYLAEDGMTLDLQKGFVPRANNSLLGKNLKALFARHQKIAEKVWMYREGWGRRRAEVIDGPSVKLQTSDGVITLHSSRGPEREAKRMAEKCLQELANSDTIRVLGVGFAWHLQALLKQCSQDRRIEVMVVDWLVFHLLLENRDVVDMIADPRLHFVERLENFNFCLPAYRRMLASTAQ